MSLEKRVKKTAYVALISFHERDEILVNVKKISLSFPRQSWPLKFEPKAKVKNSLLTAKQQLIVPDKQTNL